MIKQNEAADTTASTPEEPFDAHAPKTLTFHKYADEYDHNPINLGADYNITTTPSTSEGLIGEIQQTIRRYLTAQGDTATIDDWIIYVDFEEEWGCARADTKDGRQLIDVGIQMVNP